MMITSNLVCLFCVTAGQNGENLGSDEEQIVLFVYLLYDVTNNKIVNVQVHYVRPSPADDVSTFENVLTEECRIQTNLAEDAIKNAQPLEHVLDEFERFLCAKEVHPYHGSRPFVFLTDGPLHLRMCLLPEAIRKNITLPAHFHKYFDLRKEFKKFYKTERPINCIKDMLDFLGIEGDQSVEYGVRQCQEMAILLQRLINDGHVFVEHEVISDKLEPGVCSKDDEIDDETVVRARGLPWQSSDQDIARFFRGLNVAKGGVALCLSQQGRRNGEALVRFESKEHRDLALRKHKHHIGQRYIEVYRATGQDFLAVAGGSSDEAHEFLSRHAHNGGQVIVRMRGLPYTCLGQQVLEFFKQDPVSIDVLDGEDGILFVHQSDGRSTGDAFVLFGSDEDATNALTKHRQCIGNRYIELFKSTTAEVQQVLNRSLDPRAALIGSDVTNGIEPLQLQLHQQQQQQQQQLVSAQLLPDQLLAAIHMAGVSGVPPEAVMFPQQLITRGTKKDCLRMRGLPYESTVSDILSILGDCARNITHQGVHMIYNSMGVPSGEAFIQMDSEYAAEVATLTKSKKSFVVNCRKHFVEVIQCSGDDMNAILTSGMSECGLASAATNHLHQQYQHQWASSSIFLHPSGVTPAVSHILPTAVQRPIITSVPLGTPTILATTGGPYGNTLAAYHQPTLAIQPIVHRTTGGCAASLLQPVGLPPLRHSNHATSPSPDGLIFPTGPPSGLFAAGTAPAAAFQPILYWYPSPPVSPQNGPAPNAFYVQAPTQVMQYPTTVLMKGLPQNVQRHDVMSFIDGLVEVIPDVQFSRKSDGRPNGDAYVTFGSRIDAERVLNHCSHKPINNHFVEMQII